MQAKQQVKSTSDQVDSSMMQRAIVLARRGEGRVEPNPMVGCVIVRNRRVIGEGYHHRFGGPHAEIEALRACTTDPRGATVFVSLEPCCRHGKTPPCTDALIEARVARVVVSMGDPSTGQRGRGMRRLRAAGISVQTGVLKREAAELLAPFITRVRLGRPYVTAKWAQSLDGKLATHTGDSRWISCEASRRRVHQLRARVDAILVGSGTVLADDPMLTARGVPIRRRALRVVLDSRLRITETCQLVATAGVVPTLVLTSAKQTKMRKADRLRLRGVEVVGRRTRGKRIAFDACLQELMKRNVTNLLVEGGPTVLAALLEARVVDDAFVFAAPMLIGGGSAPGPLGGRGVRRVNAAINPRSIQTRRSGRDILYRLRLT